MSLLLSLTYLLLDVVLPEPLVGKTQIISLLLLTLFMQQKRSLISLAIFLTSYNYHLTTTQRVLQEKS